MLFPVGRPGLDLPHNIHPLRDPAECRESLPVGVALAREIERRLVAMQIKKSDTAVSAPLRAIEITPSRCRIPVTDVRSREMAGKPFVSAARPP